MPPSGCHLATFIFLLQGPCDLSYFNGLRDLSSKSRSEEEMVGCTACGCDYQTLQLEPGSSYLMTCDPGTVRIHIHVCIHDHIHTAAQSHMYALPST